MTEAATLHAGFRRELDKMDAALEMLARLAELAAEQRERLALAREAIADKLERAEKGAPC